MERHVHWQSHQLHKYGQKNEHKYSQTRIEPAKNIPARAKSRAHICAPQHEHIQPTPLLSPTPYCSYSTNRSPIYKGMHAYMYRHITVSVLLSLMPPCLDFFLLVGWTSLFRTRTHTFVSV
jgi:hypothetical protein